MSSRPTPRERFLAACGRVPLPGPPPAWVMRQAGRYLPEYRALREGRAFLELVHDPALAAELTCQPLRRFGMDAAVIFCDILVPPAAMGLNVRFEEGVGPLVTPPVRARADVEALSDFDPEERTGFLAEAIRRVRSEIGTDRAIVGFAGAPFTVASYMIEGGASRSFEHARALMLADPDLFRSLTEKIVRNQIPYLAMQVAAGADVLQIFDSWGGALSRRDWERFLKEPTTALVQGARATGAPVILYVNGGGHLLEALVETGADVIGLDWRVDPRDAIARIGDRVALQGNLDPTVLFAPPDVVRRETEAVLDAFRGQRGHVFNLGSGILPRTPVASMEAIFGTLAEHRRRHEVGL